MNDNNRSPNLKNIRTLLNEGFSEYDLRTFCYDYDDFRPVHHQLSESTGKTLIVQQLLEHAHRRELLDLLLVWAEKQNPAKYRKHQPYYSTLPPDTPQVSVKFFAYQEIGKFINTPGRYADHFKFTITNHGETIESLKLKFTFPKLEELIDKSQFSRFYTRPNTIDFDIQDQDNEYFYQMTFRPQEALLKGDTLELERAFIIYVMNLPDKKRWLKSVQKCQLKTSWQLFTNTNEPLENQQEIRDLYIGKIVVTKQNTR